MQEHSFVARVRGFQPRVVAVCALLFVLSSVAPARADEFSVPDGMCVGFTIAAGGGGSADPWLFPCSQPAPVFDETVAGEMPMTMLSIPSLTGDAWQWQSAFEDRALADAATALKDLVAGRPSVGDPILPNGEFHDVVTDVHLPGIGPAFDFTRTYRSRVRFQGVLGHGWTHSYDRRLYWVNEGTCSTRIDYVDGHFGVVHFRESSRDAAHITYAPDAGVALALEYRVAERAYVLHDSTPLETVFHGAPFEEDHTFANNGLGPWRPLTYVRDLLGHSITFLWAGGQAGFLHPRVFLAIDAAKRWIAFNYDVVGTDSFLKCLDFDGTCEHPLVSYHYDADPKSAGYAELTAALDGKGRATSYEYDHGHDQPAKAVPAVDDIETSCTRMCGKPADDCLNTNVCSSLARCVSYGNQIANCSEHCNLGCVSRMLQLWPNGHEPVGWLNNCRGSCEGGCAFENGQLETCFALAQAAYPFCRVDDTAAQCETRCVDNAVAKGIDGLPRYTFGSIPDLNHNLTVVRDGRGRAVITNVYGNDPFDVGFDRVLDQRVGELDAPETHVRLAYHDLKLEAELAQNGFVMVGGQRVLTPPSTPDSQHVRPLAAFNSVNVCTASGAAGFSIFPPDPVTTAGAATAPQLPRLATVVSTLNRNTRTLYLDDAGRLLRDVLFRKLPNPRGRGTFLDFPYETTDYNNKVHDTGVDRFVLRPGGDRVCSYAGALDVPLAVFEMPAVGAPGGAAPRVTVSSYDAHSQLTQRMVSAAPDDQRITYDRDPSTSRLNSIIKEIGSGHPAQTTRFVYATPTSVVPKEVHHPDGSVTTPLLLDSMSGEPGLVLNDASGNAPVGESRAHDDRGRVTDTASVLGAGTALRSRHVDYDPDNGLVTHVRDRNETSAQQYDTYYVYDDANQPSLIVTPDSQKSFGIDSNANVLWVNEIGATFSTPARTTCFQRAADGLLLAEMHPEGDVRVYSYDAAGRRVAVDAGYLPQLPSWALECGAAPPPPAGVPFGLERIWQAEYLPGGALANTSDGSGVTQRYVVDGLGRTIRVIDATGNQHWQGYDGLGRVAWKADYGTDVPPTYGYPAAPWHSLQAMVEFGYDLAGRVVRKDVWQFNPGRVSATPVKLRTTIVYDDATRTVTVTDPAQHTTTTRYDGASRPVYRRLPDGTEEIAVIRPDNSVVWTLPSQTGSGTTTRTVQYDDNGLISRVFDPSGFALFEEDHDVLGRVTRRRTRGAGETRTDYDSYGRVATVSRAVDTSDVGTASTLAPAHYFWDGDDRPATFADPKQNTSKRFYDGAGRPHADVDSASHTTSYDYVTGSSRIKHINAPGGTVTTRSYVNGLLHRETVLSGADTPNPGGTTTRTFRYDPLDRVVLATLDGDFAFPTRGTRVSRTYDSLGTCVLETGALVTQAISRTVDFVHNTRTTTWAGAAIVATLDARNRTASMSLNGAPVVDYHSSGGAPGPVKITYANGVATDVAYDDLGQAYAIATAGPHGNVASIHTAFGADGSPRARSYAFGQAASRSDFFTVDAAGRLTSEGLGSQLAIPAVSHPLVDADVAPLVATSADWRDYGLDWASSFQSIARSGSASSTAFVTDGLNAYTSVGGSTVGYGPRGQLVAFPADAPTEQYGFDGDGHLVHATRDARHVDYAYDALGRRVYEDDGTTKRYFVWNEGTVLAVGTDPARRDSFTLFVHANDGLVAMVGTAGRGATLYVHRSWEGSTIAVSDGEGALAEAYGYSAYGEPRFIGGDGASTLDASRIGTIHLFHGYLYDAPLRAYATGAREYKPGWGRFLSPDPSGLAGGLNLFAFANASPLTLGDPTGLDPKRLSPFQVSGGSADSDSGPGFLQRAGIDGCGPAGCFNMSAQDVRNFNPLPFVEGLHTPSYAISAGLYAGVGGKVVVEYDAESGRHGLTLAGGIGIGVELDVSREARLPNWSGKYGEFGADAALVVAGIPLVIADVSVVNTNDYYDPASYSSANLMVTPFFGVEADSKTGVHAGVLGAIYTFTNEVALDGALNKWAREDSRLNGKEWDVGHVIGKNLKVGIDAHLVAGHKWVWGGDE